MMVKEWEERGGQAGGHLSCLLPNFCDIIRCSRCAGCFGASRVCFEGAPGARTSQAVWKLSAVDWKSARLDGFGTAHKIKDLWGNLLFCMYTLSFQAHGPGGWSGGVQRAGKWGLPSLGIGRWGILDCWLTGVLIYSPYYIHTETHTKFELY